MKIKNLFKKLENNPYLIERVILIIGVLSIISIMISASIIMYNRAQADIIHQAEEDAVHISQVIIRQQRDILFSSKDDHVSIAKQQYKKIDKSIRDVLVPFHVIKIKIFNPKYRLIYSNEKDIVGLVDYMNTHLKQALSGDVVSKIETKDSMADLYQEKQYNVDIVEVYFPLYNSNGEIGGAMELYMDVTRYKDDINQWVVFTIINLGAILIIIFGLSYLIIHWFVSQLSGLMTKLYRLSTTDSLTGLLNHDTIISQGRKELSRLTRKNIEDKVEQNSISAIMFDIDDFKVINDTYGHQVGDEVLRLLSSRVQSMLREYDIFGRYGGEEFLMFLPSTGIKEASAIAKRLCDAINKSPFNLNSINLRITASFGVSVLKDSDEDIGSLIKRADEGLYISKKNGKNQVNVVL